MNVIPWRRREGALSTENGFEDLWRSFWGPLEEGRSRLPAAFQARNVPAMNVAETESHFNVSLELPGMEVEDIQIDLMGNQLTVSGERKWEQEKQGKEYHRVESQYGGFSRSVSLPEHLRFDSDKVEATFQKGMLEIRIPKVEPTPSTKIQVKAR
jgi:HSP20 family protein